MQSLLIRLRLLQREYLPEGSLRARFALGTAWSLVGAVISRGLNLIASMVVARMLGTVGFGELGIIQSTVGMFGVFAGFGLGMTATKYVAEYRSADPAKAGRIVGISSLVAMVSGAVVSILLLACAPWLAAHSLAAPHLSGLLQISAVLLFFSAVGGSQTGALSGLEAFKEIAVVNLMAGLSSFPLIIGGAYFGGVGGAVLGLSSSAAINCLLNYHALRRKATAENIPMGYKGCMTELSVLWKFSMPAVLSSAMVGPVNWICAALLVNQKSGYIEMGYFNAANQWFYALLFIPGILGQALLPILSERVGLKDNASSGRVMVLSIKVNAVVAGSLAFAVAGISPFIMELYGSVFRAAWPVLIVSLSTAVLLSVQTPVGHIIAASGRMWVGFWMNMGWGIIYIGCTYALLAWGALGLSAARTLAYAVHAVWTFAFAFRYLRLQSKTGLA